MRDNAQKFTPHRVYTEVVDGEVFTLQESDPPEREYGDDPYEYVIRRGGEAVLGVLRKGTSYYYIYSPEDPDRHYIGYVQHSRRGALLAAALLLTRGIPPMKPETDEGNLRQLVASRPG